MKVYIVTSGSYSDYTIEAVFTDKGQAELYGAIYKYEIEEFETDEYKIEGKKEDLKEAWMYEKGLDLFGLLYERLYFDSLTFDDKDAINVQKTPRPKIEIRKMFDRDTDREKIMKIMRDEYARISYEAQAECDEKTELWRTIWER
jgi:hypothetical protein